MASSCALVLGPWQLRHGEPMPHSSQALEVAELPELDLACSSLVVDQRQFSGELFSAQRIPLAVMAEIGGQSSIAYLLHALDNHSALFFRVQEPAGSNGPLNRRIANLFESLHLRLNNNECYYAVAEPARAARAIVCRHSYWTLGFYLHALIDENAFPHVRPQFRVPPRARYLDVEAYELERPAENGARYAVVNHCARLRSDWEQKLVNVETVSLTDSGVYRRYPIGELDAGAGGCNDKLATLIGRALRPLAKWRKLSIEIPVESLLTGNLFVISIEDCRVTAASPLRRVFARVGYEKTRGVRPLLGPGAEVDRLMERVGAALEAREARVVAGCDILSEIVASAVHA
jgi:hypothetical protein